MVGAMDGPGASELRRRGTALGCALVLASTCLLVGRASGAEPPKAPESPNGLERAPIWRSKSLTRRPSPSTARPRLRVVLRDQGLLHRAVQLTNPSPGIPSVWSRTRQAARMNPGRITRAELARGARIEHRRGAMVQQLSRAVPAVEDSLQRLQREVRSLGGRVLSRELLPAGLVVRVPARTLGHLLRLPGVATVTPEPKPEPLLDVSVEEIGAPTWWGEGHTEGSGYADQFAADAAVLGEAPDLAHPAFAGVEIVNESGMSRGQHGTETGGIIASQDPTFMGVAPGVDTLIGAAKTSAALGLNPQETGIVDAAEVVSYSYGSVAGDDEVGINGDVVVAALGVGRAAAGGNEHDDPEIYGSGPTVNNIGRNILSVAAYNDADTLTAADDKVATFSSRGPSPGGRKKPDLTAPGVGIMAPSSSWNSPPGNLDFTSVNGTSFSTPHVAGAMTLLAGAGILDPMVQRAILINSARDWDGDEAGLNGWPQPPDVAQTGWRAEVGWGALDLTQALEERGNYAVSAVREGEAAYFRASGLTEGEKSTMAFELRGYWPDYPRPGSRPLVYTQSNLDLRQFHPDGEQVPPPEEFVPPWPGQPAGPDAVDPNDTVEQVRAPAGAGPMILAVEAASEVKGVEAEPFAITSAVPLDPLVAPIVRPVGVRSSTSGPVACGSPVTISAQASNPSPDLGSSSTQLSIDLPAGISLISGPISQVVSGGELAAGETSEARTWVVAATAHGSHRIGFTGYGEAYGTGVERSGAGVTVTADCSPPRTPPGPYGPIPDPPADPGDPDLTPALKVKHRRLRARKRSVGTLRVRMPKPGAVVIRSSARWRKVRAPIKRVRVSPRDRRATVRLRASRRTIRRVRRTLRKGRRVRIKVKATFRDNHGNSARSKLSYRLRNRTKSRKAHHRPQRSNR